MKPNELRINNFYESTKFRIRVRCEASDIAQIYYNADGTKVDEDHVATVFKPLPLTDKWLIKLGFKPFGKDWVLNGIIIHTRKRGYVINKKVQIIKFVHQLQNIYFALTGEELTYG